MKSANWISQIGRMPYKAAPMPTPMIDNSASGESRIRPGPYFSYNPCVARKPPPRGPTSSPRMKTRSSRASSSSIAWRRASIRVISVTAYILDIHRVGGFANLWERRRLGEPNRIIDRGDGLLLHLAFGLLGEQLLLPQGFLVGRQRIAGLHRLDLGPRPI